MASGSREINTGGSDMTTYSQADFEQIAESIGKRVADILREKERFESAAVWYRQDSRSSAIDRVAPSKISKRMTQIARAARKLLRHLEVCDPRDAQDGTGGIELLEFLASADDRIEDDDDGPEDVVVRATARVGRLVEIFESIAATGELERRACKAAVDAIRIGELIVPKSHLGDVAINNWVAAIISIYERITVKPAGISAIAPGRPGEGRASGPFLRFLETTAAPLQIRLSGYAWRARVRDILKHRRQK